MPFAKNFFKKTNIQSTKNNDENENRDQNNIIHNTKIVITLDELEDAKRVIIKNCQDLHFYNEIETSKTNQSITKGVHKPLYPFLDHYGVLRVGGRLRNSQFEYNKIHPIIIPRNCNLAILIIRDSHKKTLHGGNQLTLACILDYRWERFGQIGNKQVYSVSPISIIYNYPTHGKSAC